jgi:hypothetical protein
VVPVDAGQADGSGSGRLGRRAARPGARGGRDAAESGQHCPREARAPGGIVDTGVGRDRSADLLAATGYVAGVGLLVWGLLAGEVLPILLGLAILGLVRVARPAA